MVQKNTGVQVIDLGIIGYKEAWDLQQKLLEKCINIKMRNRQYSESLQTPNLLLFCEHPHVYSIGKSGDMENLLITEKELHDRKIEFYRTNRGGDITYHGPGQLVCYPILDLENFTTDIHLYLRNLEETVITVLKNYGIQGIRVPGLTGVWTDQEEVEQSKKICAIGVRTSRWVTMHGMALNINTDLSYFESIVPCGIDDKGVTSLANEVGHSIPLHEIKDHICTAFSAVFNATTVKGESHSVLSASA